MASNFLYLKVKNSQFFNNSPNPQKDSVAIYVTKNNGKFVLVAKDDNGQHHNLNLNNYYTKEQIDNIIGNIYNSLNKLLDNDNSSESSSSESSSESL